MRIRGINNIKNNLNNYVEKLQKLQGKKDIHIYLTSDFLMYITDNKYDSIEKIIEYSGIFDYPQDFNRNDEVINKDFDKFLIMITNNKVSSFINLIEQAAIYLLKKPNS